MNDFNAELVEAVISRIRDVPDFPKPGIVFKDLTPVLAHGPTFQRIVSAFADRYRDRNLTSVAAIEARGFILGAPIAAALGVGLTVLRKPNKLPWKKVSQKYDLEYGSDALEMHEDALDRGARVIVVDDLLATGGTMRAAIDLVRSRNVELLEVAFMVELGFLAGRQRLDGVPVVALARY